MRARIFIADISLINLFLDRYFFKCGRTLQQEIPAGSPWYTRAMGDDPECQEPFAPNSFGIGYPQLWSHDFFERDAECGACRVIRLRVSVPADTKVRDLLPQLAEVLAVHPDQFEANGGFFPKLFLRPSSADMDDVVLLYQDFETNDYKGAERSISRYVIGLLRPLCWPMQLVCESRAQEQHGQDSG